MSTVNELLAASTRSNGKVLISPARAAAMCAQAEPSNVHRLTPEAKRDEWGSYLEGDRSVALARAISADIRRRALTEPGYLDHWKVGVVAVPPPAIHKTTLANPAPEQRALPAAAPAPRRSARLARPARAPAPATSARSRRAAYLALQAAAVRLAAASLPARHRVRSWPVPFQVVE